MAVLDHSLRTEDENVEDEDDIKSRDFAFLLSNTSANEHRFLPREVLTGTASAGYFACLHSQLPSVTILPTGLPARY